MQTGNNLSPTPSIDAISRAVIAAFGVRLADLTNSSRKQSAIDARHSAIFLAAHITWRPWSETARLFGLRDHHTASRAYLRMRQQVSQATDAGLAVLGAC